MTTVGIEGPCCSGKTTLSENLRKEFAEGRLKIVPDYADFVGGGVNLPPAIPNSVDDEVKALAVFEEIERSRIQVFGLPEEGTEIIVIDRCVHTLLAHCFALTEKFGQNFYLAAETRFERSLVPLWPDVIIYLDVPIGTIGERNRGKFAPGSIFIDEEFNSGFRNYFIPELRHGKERAELFCVDGRERPEMICSKVMDFLGSRIHRL